MIQIQITSKDCTTVQTISNEFNSLIQVENLSNLKSLGENMKQNAQALTKKFDLFQMILSAAKSDEMLFLSLLVLVSSMDKSTKLRWGFEISSNSPKLELDYDGMVQLLEGFLTSIALVTRHSDHQHKEEHEPRPRPQSEENDGGAGKKKSSALNEDIYNTAVWATEQMFLKLKKSIPNDKIPFELFGEWYNLGGYEVVPWLELLDLKKWASQLVKSGNANQSSTPTTASSSSYISNSDSKSGQNQSEVNNRPLHHTPDAGVSENRRQRDGGRCVISFDFSGNKPIRVNITENNLIMLKSLVMTSQLNQKETKEVIDFITQSSDNCGVMDRGRFDTCMNQLLSLESANNSNKAAFQSFLSDLFSCLDRESTKTVIGREVAAAFTIMCQGNKSSKLAVGFELMDEKQNSYLSNVQLKALLRSYLVMLISISLSTSSLSRQDVFEAVENGCGWTQSNILNSSVCAVNTRVAFEEFAHWYSGGGYNVAPWLELLDLTKVLSLLEEPRMPPPPNSVPTPDSINKTPTNFSSDIFSEEMNLQGSQVLFSFPLAKGNNLIVLLDDVRYIRKIVDKLGFDKITADNVWEVLMNRTNYKNCLDQPTFVTGMEKLIHEHGKKVTPDMLYILENFFYSFDIEQAGEVGVDKLVGGLTLLCDGKKSNKLAFSFNIFDQGKKGGLDSNELFQFFRSFLIVMFSCSAQSVNLSATTVSTWIADTSHMVCKDVMQPVWESGRKIVTFHEFGEWYNGGGYEALPWLELLDLKKWVYDDTLIHQPSLPSPGDHRNSRGMDVDDTLKFHLVTHENANGVLIAINPSQVQNCKALVLESKLISMQPKDVSRCLLKHSSGGMLTKDKYDDAIRSMIKGESLSRDSKLRLSEMLTHIYFSYDREKRHKVDAFDIACGFALLCDGSKSDKLEFAYDLMDFDKDGKLSPRELWRFLRAFLTILLSLSSARTNMGENNVVHLVDGSASWAVSQVYAGKPMNEQNRLSFDEFGLWYTKGGYGCIPWLELLDLRKWVLAS